MKLKAGLPLKVTVFGYVALSGFLSKIICHKNSNNSGIMEPILDFVKFKHRCLHLSYYPFCLFPLFSDDQLLEYFVKIVITCIIRDCYEKN